MAINADMIKVVKEDMETVDDETGARSKDVVEVDPMEMLLDSESRRDLHDFVSLRRKNKSFKVKIRAIDGDTYDKLQEDATTTKQNRRTQAVVRETDFRMVRRLVVLHGVIEPDLFNEDLLKKYNVDKGAEYNVVDKAFLPGEVDKIAERVLTLSGYDEEFVELAKH